MAEECIHGLELGTCSLCLHGPPAGRRPPTVVSTFAARYEGTCTGCSLPIAVGQIVHGLSTGVYCHQGCE